MKRTFSIFALVIVSVLASSFVNEKAPAPTAKAPVYPVAGKRARVGSFWGAVRDGGRRKHEGIDIFAKKGTPVVAVSDGIVAVGNGGRGGKYVWLRSSTHPWTAYYAHLNTFKVRHGQRVKKGQVLGTVGNTGNAKYTPSHLHFGIYTARGPVNPLPYVKNSPRILVTPPTKKAVAQKAANTKTQQPVAKRPVTNGFEKRYIHKRLRVSADPSAQYYVTTRSNVVRVKGDKVQVVGRWLKGNSAKYPYNIVMANKQRLLVNKAGKVVTTSGQAVGSVS